MDIEAQVKRKITKAMVGLRRRSPAYAYVASTLKKVADPTCKTAWTDGVSLGYNPDHILTIDIEEAISLLAHEAEHVIKGDPWRLHQWFQRVGALVELKGQETAKRCFNQGSDHGINLRLKRNRYQIGDDWPADPAYDKVAAEKIATELLKAAPDKQDGQGDNDEQSNNDSESSNPEPGLTKPGEECGDDGRERGNEGADSTSFPDGDQGGDGQPGGESGTNDPQSAPDSDQGADRGNGSPDDTGAGTGAPDAPQDQSNGGGEVRPFPTEDEPGSHQAMKEAERGFSKLRQNMANAMRYAEGNGETDEGVLNDIEAILACPVDWDALLREFMYEKVPEDYSWDRPNRNYIQRGIYLPTLRSEGLGTVVMITDTSGSMPRPAFDMAATHAHQICNELGAKLVVVYVDTAVRGIEYLEREDDPLDLQPVGGGGTDFRPGFAWLEENDDIDADCILYFTDMQCSRFPQAHEIDTPVLWVQWGDYDAPEPPFGELVIMDTEGGLS